MKKMKNKSRAVFSYITDPQTVSRLSQVDGTEVNRIATSAVLRAIGKPPKPRPRKVDNAGRMWVRITDPVAVDYILNRKAIDGVSARHTITTAINNEVKK